MLKFTKYIGNLDDRSTIYHNTLGVSNAKIFQSMVTPLKSNKTDNYTPTNCWQSNSDDLI